MKTPMYIILYLFSNFFRTYNLHMVYKTFYNESRTRRSTFFGFSLFYVTISVEYILFDLPIVTLFLNWIGLFTLSFLYNTTILRSFISSIFALSLTCFSEILIMLFSGITSFSFIKKGFYASYLGVSIEPIVLLICCLIYKKLKKSKENFRLSLSNNIIVFAIPSICLFISLLLFSINHIPELQFIIIVILLLILCFGSIWLYDRQLYFYEKEEDQKILILQNQFFHDEMEHMHLIEDSTRKIRHDIKNHLLSIMILAKKNNDYDVTNYINPLISDLQQNQEFVNCGNFVINGICNYYISIVKQYNTDLKYNICFPDNITINENDFTILLGNLWSNCIENSKESNTPFIDFQLLYDRNRLIISVQNTYAGKREKINNSFPSTKANPHYHGIGLKNIEHIVKKYNGTIKLQCSDNLFHTQILMYFD